MSKRTVLRKRLTPFKLDSATNVIHVYMLNDIKLQL